MNRLYNIVLFTALAILFAACQKKSNAAADAANVSLSITSPANGQLVIGNDSISLIAAASYSGELHGYELKITDTSSGLIVYDLAEHAHSDQYSINKKWSYSGSQAIVLKMEFVVEVDHNGTTAEKTVFFTCKP